MFDRIRARLSNSLAELAYALGKVADRMERSEAENSLPGDATELQIADRLSALRPEYGEWSPETPEEYDLFSPGAIYGVLKILGHEYGCQVEKTMSTCGTSIHLLVMVHPEWSDRFGNTAHPNAVLYEWSHRSLAFVGYGARRRFACLHISFLVGSAGITDEKLIIAANLATCLVPPLAKFCQDLVHSRHDYSAKAYPLIAEELTKFPQREWRTRLNA